MTAKSSRPIRLTAELIQCHMCNCFSQKAFRLFLIAERGGVANFFVDNGRMRFAVNPKAAERSQLRISSRLLSLARIVHHAGP